MNTRATDRRQRNKLARQQIIYVVDEYGLRWNYVAKKMNMDSSNLAHWRKERFEFSFSRLKQLEDFIDGYLDKVG
ncbi:hypothetical protein [Sporosarcina beigongshangi]|uniref:hypothetical protein n=1 Tax=Sporosarcina beigongshangi TaxID=2782538 RepID=UPI001939A191|nr:hypothetical protein [Sporosarcina beigongshangi]